MKTRNRILYHLGILDPDCDEASEDEFDQMKSRKKYLHLYVYTVKL